MERVIGKQDARLLLQNLVRRERLDEGLGKQSPELTGELGVLLVDALPGNPLIRSATYKPLAPGPASEPLIGNKFCPIRSQPLESNESGGSLVLPLRLLSSPPEEDAEQRQENDEGSHAKPETISVARTRVIACENLEPPAGLSLLVHDASLSGSDAGVFKEVSARGCGLSPDDSSVAVQPLRITTGTLECRLAAVARVVPIVRLRAKPVEER